MKIIVAGSRTFQDRQLLCDTLDRLTMKLDEVFLISGGSKGADKMAQDWAYSNGWNYEIHHAEWTRLGKGAGMIRNTAMVQAAGKDGCLIAFHQNNSPGTADIIAKARKAGLKVKVIKV